MIMLEDTFEKTEKKELTADLKDEIIARIADLWTDWNDLRLDQIEKYKKLKEEIYLEPRETKKNEWKSNR
jgi:hypothetical protein